MSAQLDGLSADFAVLSATITKAVGLIQSLKAAVDAGSADPAKVADLRAAVVAANTALGDAITAAGG